MSELDFTPVNPVIYKLGRGERLKGIVPKAGELAIFMQYFRLDDGELAGTQKAMIRSNISKGGVHIINFSLAPKHLLEYDIEPTEGIFSEGFWQPESEPNLSLHGIPLRGGYFRRPNNAEASEATLQEMGRTIDAIFEDNV